jgi:hypothetical protein
MNKYPLNPTPSAPISVETTAPLRASRVDSEFVVPFLQTVFTAVLLGLCIALWRWRPDAGLVATAALLIWSWRILRSDKLLWQIERLTHHDLDGDGVQGEPTMTIVNGRDARQQAGHDPYNTLRDTAAAQQSLTAFVYLCSSVERPTEEALGIPTGDRAGYVKYRNKLMDLGIAAWDNPDRHSAGWHLAVTPDMAAAIIEKHLV